MKRSKILTGFATALALALSTSLGAMPVAQANGDGGGNDAGNANVTVPSQEPVRSISLMTGLWGFKAIDEHHVIIWTTPSRPYLVTLRFPSHDLRWVNVIGITSSLGRVYSGFDSVQVMGFKYPIDTITPLTREEARDYGRDS